MLNRLFLLYSVLLVPWVVLAQESGSAETAEAEKGAWLHIRGPKSSQAHIGGGSSITCSITAPEEDNFLWMKINEDMWDQLPEDSAWREASFHRHVERFENGSVSTAISGYIDNFREEHSAQVMCGSNNPDHQRFASMMLEFKNNDKGGRDDSRDWYYESDEFWEMPDSNRRCGRGQGLDASGANCVDCPAGTYNFEDSRVDTCIPCPLGYFGNQTGMDECYDCENWGENRRGKYTTLLHGSTSSEQCIRPGRLISKFAYAKVGFRIMVKGGDFCTNIRRALWGVSKVIPFDGHFYECSYSPASETSPNAFSAMSFEATLPSKMAWEFWEALDVIRTHRDVANAYIKLGRPMVDKIGEFVGNHSELWQLNMTLRTDMLNVDDLEILEFAPYFQGQCQPGDNSKFCDGQTSAAATVQRFYIKYSVAGSLINCASNAGYTRVRNIMERSAERGLPCLTRESGRCKMELVSCRDGEVIVALTNSFIEEANKIESLDALRDMIPSFAAMDTQFSKVDAIEGCPEGGAAFKEASAAEVAGFQVECAACEAGNFINDAGMCQRCPFGSWGEDGKQCNSCGWEFATPFWGVDRKDKCIEISNDWRRTDKSSYDDYLRDVKGENRFNLTIIPQMNMCGVSEAVKEVKKSCSSAYPAADLMWDDSLDFEEIKLERILCMGVSNIQKGFSEMCDADWDKSWKEIFEALEYDFWEEDNLKDAVCYIFKRVKDLDTLDTSGNCPNLDPSQYMMSMAAEFFDELDIESSAVVIPIMRRLRNLKSMDFSSFADAGRAMMETMGINDPVAFTGWDTAKELRELILSVPNGFRMAEFEFEPKFNKEDFYCDNNNAKRWCSGCYMENCNVYSEDKGKDVHCRADECNNCSPSYWYFTNQTTADDSTNQTTAGNETSKLEPYSCATCDFPEEIDNGKLLEVSKNGVNAVYTCNDGYVLDSCSGWAQCEWQNRSNSIDFPRCVEDKCVWPEIDNAAIWRDWRDVEYWAGCPFATYKCNDGWMAANNYARAECRTAEDFRIDHSVQCIERCSFPDVIANGTRDDSQSGRTEDGRYYARYECNEGFYPRDGDYAYCNTEKYYEGEEMKFKAVAWIPSCRMGDTCEFPDVIGGARKDDEWENYGKKQARYECPDNMMMRGGSGYVRCNETEPSQLGYHNFTCHERKSCHFPDTIDGGRIIEKYDTSARYECFDGYEMDGSDWADCNEWNGEAYLPTCGKDTCNLPEQIDNGNRTQKYLNAARYECYGNWQLPLSIRYTGGWVKCNGTDVLPTEPSCSEADSCHLPEKIYNGHQAEKHHNKARYECHGEWRLPESLRNNGGWVECSADGSHSPQYPSCEYGGTTDEDSCSLPEQIDNGHRAEKHYNKARYECHGEWRLPESLRNNDGWVECTGEGSHSPEYPRCEYGGGESECSFPDVIWGGYKYMEGENDEDKYAVYACNELFVMTPNKYAFVSMVKELGKSPQEAYDMLSNVATCYKGRVMLPECRHRDEAGHCGIPVYIPNGKAKELKMMDYQKEDSSTAERSEDGASEDGASEDGKSEDGASEDGKSEYDYEKMMLMMMPVAARYECESGYKIHETMKGSWGWCRKDRSYEIPRCEAMAEWNEVEFKLHNGNENKFAVNGRVFAGVVLAKRNYARERREAEDKWEYGCNDGFNGYAAGAICRSVGFNHGTEIPLTKKMQMKLPENLEFGWTDFNCDYDDTMSSSSHCRAERYEEAMGERGMKARCFNFDRIAVKCFDNAQFNVTVSVWNNKNTITCQAMAYKEDKSIPIGWIDEIEPKFMIDDKVLNLKPKYNKKRGYYVKAKNQLKEEFSCISCEVHAGEYLVGKAEKCKEE